AAALHLLEEPAAANRAHEGDNFEWPDVSAGSDHVHGDSDARIVAVAEGRKKVFRLNASIDPGDLFYLLAIGRFFLDDHPCCASPICDLLGEVVPLAELLAQNLNDIVGVAVVLGKDQCFGHFGAARENLREETVSKGLNDGANLVFGNYIAVELVGRIAE